MAIASLRISSFMVETSILLILATVVWVTIFMIVSQPSLICVTVQISKHNGVHSLMGIKG